MDTLKETIPLIEDNLERYGLVWINTGRKAEDWKFRIYESRKNGRQMGVYYRADTLIRLEAYSSSINGVMVRSEKCPKSSAANAGFSRFRGGLGVCVEVQDKFALERLLDVYFGAADDRVPQELDSSAATGSKGLLYYELLFTQLNANKSKGHTSPHKMCLLLAVIDLIGNGHIKENKIYFDENLRKRFSDYFIRYRSANDRDNPPLPFFHLRSETFWHHHIKPGKTEEYKGLSTASGPGVIDRLIAYAYLDEQLYEQRKNKFVRDFLTASLESTMSKGEQRGLLTPTIGWDWLECEVTVQSYFSMLDKELRGAKYNKAEHRRKLLPLLNNRSEASVEFKHQNISAILVELGYPYIAGYKPAYNYQSQLKEVVEVYLVEHYMALADESEAFIENGIDEPVEVDWATVIEDEPEREDLPKESVNRQFNPRKYNYAERENANRKLGEAGEKFVLAYECYRMEKAGRADLTNEIVWTSKEEGDGAGYDIRSFNPQKDEELFIEVKTTNSGKYQPFYISDNEVSFAEQNPNNYALYRVFQFSVSPKLFALYGNLSEHVNLMPKSYRASFRG